MFIIIDQRIVKEASHTLFLQEAIYHVGKILGMKFQNVFSDSTCVSTYQGCKRAPHGYIECKGFHTQTSMVLFEKGKNPPPRILDVKLYFC